MDRFIDFYTRDTFSRVWLKQIVFFSADKNYTLLQLNSGKKLVFTFSLKKMEEYLKMQLEDYADMFVRIGKSHIVNLHYVFQMDIVKQKLILLDHDSQRDFVLDVSKESLKNFRNLFASQYNIIQND